MIKLSKNVKQYLWEEFSRNNIPKFYKYFDEWIENLTDEQITFYTAYSEGKKTIIHCIDSKLEIVDDPKDYVAIANTIPEIKME